MERFRPNVVIDGAEDPFAEDGWRTLWTEPGDTVHHPVALRASELVDRCIITTVDPQTLVRGQEPLRTLAKHRRWDGNVWFGIRLVPTTTGTLQVGDAVHVTTAGRHEAELETERDVDLEREPDHEPRHAPAPPAPVAFGG
jgi:uncharacterized protein YcbX